MGMSGNRWRAAASCLIGAFVMGGGVGAVMAHQEGPDTMLRAALDGCASCHGTEGRSADSRIPHLRGQNYDYLVDQLLRFARVRPGSSTEGEPEQISPIVRGGERSAGRSSDLMQQHTRGLTDALLRQLARFYAQMPCEQAESPPRVSVPPVGMAWCDDCHGRRKVRGLTNVPVLHGQWAAYLESQLRAFKREAIDAKAESANARSHHFMTRTARIVSDRQIREVSRYYGQQSCVE